MPIELPPKQLPHCIYLHGFASGPGSSKAKYFASRLRESGFDVDVPDLNGDDFSQMTLSSQLAIVDSLMARVSDRPVICLGSSMGGLISTLKSQQSPAVKALILFAPGFGIGKRWADLVGANEFNEWRSKGYTNVFHYGLNCDKQLSYNFIVDAEQYQTENLPISVPALVFHGKNDETVPVRESIAFKDFNSDNVELHVLDSDHQLFEPLPQMWQITQQFLIKQGLLKIIGR